MCMYTRHKIFLPKQWRFQLSFDTCFDINVRELDVNKKKIDACIEIYNIFLKMDIDMNKIK